MEKCKYCVHIWLWKSGIVRKKQRYKCPECRRMLCKKDSQIKFTDKERETTIALYIGENGFRRIAKILTQIYRKSLSYPNR